MTKSNKIILGILAGYLVIMLIIFLWKHRIKKDKISNAIFVGISIQLLHWMITGNIWQYYFWMEIVFLLGYYRGVNWQVEERDCLI